MSGDSPFFTIEISFQNQGYKDYNDKKRSCYVGEYCIAWFRPDGTVKQDYDKVKESQLNYRAAGEETFETQKV